MSPIIIYTTEWIDFLQNKCRLII